MMDDLIEDSLRDDPATERDAFRAGVMQKVQADVETPPLRFPWKVALLSIALGATAGVILAYFLR